MRILIVEDDADLARQLKTTLKDAGYAVDTAKDGEEGHFLGDTEPYDAVVLDLGLPLIDGVSVLQKWRADGKSFPVLILTARDQWSEKVAGFDAQAFPHRRADGASTGPFASCLWPYDRHDRNRRPDRRQPLGAGLYRRYGSETDQP